MTWTPKSPDVADPEEAMPRILGSYVESEGGARDSIARLEPVFRFKQTMG
jgi:hypothetical protein